MLLQDPVENAAGAKVGDKPSCAAVSPRVHRLAVRLTEESRLCRQVKGPYP